jgi:hypothetical protein
MASQPWDGYDRLTKSEYVVGRGSSRGNTDMGQHCAERGTVEATTFRGDIVLTDRGQDLMAKV